MRYAFIAMLLAATVAYAEGVLKPTDKELAIILDIDNNTPARQKLVDKFAGRTVQIKGPVAVKTTPIPGATVASSEFTVNIATPGRGYLKINWAKGTEKDQDAIRKETKTITLYGHLAISSMLVTLNDATTEKP